MGRRNRQAKRSHNKIVSSNGIGSTPAKAAPDGTEKPVEDNIVISQKDEDFQHSIAELSTYGELGKTAQLQVEEIIQGALQKAKEIIESIRTDEAKIREEYLKEQEQSIDELRKVAEAQTESILQHAREEAKVVHQEAAEVRAQAEQAWMAALAEKEALAKLAQKELEDQKKQAEKILEERKRLLELRLAQRERQLDEKAKMLRQREEDIRIQEEDLEFNKETYKLQREELKKRWEECSPDKVYFLERELEVANQKVLQLSEIASQVQFENNALRNEQVITAGRPVSAVISDLEQNRIMVKSLQDRLAAYPSEPELSLLKQEASESRLLREQVFSLQHQIASAEERALRLELGQRELQQVKVQAEGLRILNEELRNELQRNSEALEQKRGHCFPELLRLDKLSTVPPIIQQSQSTGRNLLKHLVDFIRDFAGSRTTPLYYSGTDIRAFIAGLATSPFMILQGLSGTGKTSLPRVFAKAIKGVEKRITVQSNWRDRHELLGYYNDFNKRFSESEFTQAVYRAGLPSEKDVPWFIVLDEMNLARCEYYFADFLSALEEPDSQDWKIELMSFDPSSGGKQGPKYLEGGKYLKIPENLWFIGTVNQDDSTFDISDKVYDRAQIIEFRERQNKTPVAKKLTANQITLQSLNKSFNFAKGNPQYQLEQAHWDYIYGLDAFLRDNFDISFGNRFEEQLKVFVPVFYSCGGTKEEAIDFQIARKVLRKLNASHGLKAKNSDLENKLKEYPSGPQTLKLSLAVVKRWSERMIWNS